MNWHSLVRTALIIPVLGGVPLFALAATLTLSPATGTFAPSDIFSVSILLDTEGATTSGVDIRYLNFDPVLFEVQDDDTSVSGVQITPGSLMALTQVNAVNSATGRIEFSQVPSGGGTFTGSGTLATVRFRVVTTGTAAVNFDFTVGSTTDTNVASTGVDILSAVTNGSYTLSSATPPPPPPPPAGGGGGGGGSSPPPPPPTSGGGGGGGGGGTVLNNVGVFDLAQQRLTGTAIIEGGETDDSIVVFRARLQDVNISRLRLEIELRRDGEAFTGIPTLTSLDYNSGDTARVERGGLVSGAYQWKARAVTVFGERSDWVDFGSPLGSDFIVSAIPPAGIRYSFTRDLFFGMRNSEEVKNLQQVLYQEGVYPENIISGNFFSLTQKAAIAFQKKYSIAPAVGYVGPLTRGKLNELYGGGAALPPPAAPAVGVLVGPFGPGLSGEQVRLLQAVLARDPAVYPEGLITGYYGPLTTEAVKRFQAKYGIEMTGIAGPVTRAKLNELYGGK